MAHPLQEHSTEGVMWFDFMCKLLNFLPRATYPNQIKLKLQLNCKYGVYFFKKKLSKHARLLGSSEYLSVFEVLAIVICYRLA